MADLFELSYEWPAKRGKRADDVSPEDVIYALLGNEQSLVLPGKNPRHVIWMDEKDFDALPR